MKSRYGYEVFGQTEGTIIVILTIDDLIAF